jgi:6-phosphogluconolactonase
MSLIKSKRTLLVHALKIALIPLFFGANMSYADESAPLAPAAKNLPAQTLLVGSWTGQTTGEGVQKAIYPSQGIYRLRLNSDGTLLPLDVLKLSSPSWIVFSHDHKFAYTTNENETGSVTALTASCTLTMKLRAKARTQRMPPLPLTENIYSPRTTR